VPEITGRRYDTGQTVAVHFDGQRITRIEPLAAEPGSAADLPWIAPGLVDLQVNGYHGQEFNDPQLTVAKISKVCRAMEPDGVTSFLPTATTHRSEMLLHTFATLAAACERDEDVAQRVAGFHLEGPYISPQDGPRGAHPREHCRPPDWDEFQRFQAAAGGRIKIITLSPEYDEAPAFIARAAAGGVLVAIGHTAADSEQIRAAVEQCRGGVVGAALKTSG